MDGNSDSVVQSGPDIVVGVVSSCSSTERCSGWHNVAWIQHCYSRRPDVFTRVKWHKVTKYHLQTSFHVWNTAGRYLV